MIKILWADDQPDIVKTLSGLLFPLDARITSVRNGTAALNELKANYFDVLILDLLMPPDTWGGLWLLEQIQKAHVRTPVIVLSGEGTQNETIQALRLGAKDYVTKDNVQGELLQRVRAILEQTNQEVDSYATTSFPTPLAIPYKRYLHTTALVSQLRRLIEFYESSLRLSCIIGICELGSLPKERTDSLKLISQMTLGPSMGTWDQMRHVLAGLLNQDCVFFQLHNSFDDKMVNSIIRLRNDISHGAEPSERRAQELLNKWKPQLQTLVNRLWQSLNMRIFLPLNLYYDGAEFQIEGRTLIGDSVTLPKFIVKTTRPMICNQSYLLAGEDIERQSVNLFPLLLTEPAVEPNAWRVLVFDGVKVDPNVQMLTGEEPIRYLDTWSGQRNEIPASKPRSALLPEFLSQRIVSQNSSTR